MRGLSGAVTALILVVASVIIALIVVGFAFNLFSTFGSTNAVTAVGPAYVYYNKPPGVPWGGGLYLNVTIDNRGPATPITSATVNGVSVQGLEVWVYYGGNNTVWKGNSIPAGQNNLIITFWGNGFGSAAGTNPTTIQLVLGNGQTIYIAATPV